jgi:hypothetical protein
MTSPTVTETRRNGNPVGERVELARYTIPAAPRGSSTASASRASCVFC